TSTWKHRTSEVAEPTARLLSISRWAAITTLPFTPLGAQLAAAVLFIAHLSAIGTTTAATGTRSAKSSRRFRSFAPLIRLPTPADVAAVALSNICQIGIESQLAIARES